MIDRRVSDRRDDADDRRDADRRFDGRDDSKAGVRFLRAGSSLNEVLHGQLLDASATGIRVLLEEPLEESEKLLVEVRTAQDHCFNLMVEVIWAEVTEDRFHVGCELCVELSSRQHALLKQLVADVSST